jgi:hypothetical protein
MNSLKIVRFYDSSLPLLYNQKCPKCGNLLIPSSYAQYYADTPTNQASEYWCEYEREIIALWQTSPDSIPTAKAFAADFIQDNQVLLVNNRPTLFSVRLKSLIERCSICERDGMHGTGNMFYYRKRWSVEFWCTYDTEVYNLGFKDTTLLIQEIVTEGIARGQFSPDL